LRGLTNVYLAALVWKQNCPRGRDGTAGRDPRRLHRHFARVGGSLALDRDASQQRRVIAYFFGAIDALARANDLDETRALSARVTRAPAPGLDRAGEYVRDGGRTRRTAPKREPGRPLPDRAPGPSAPRGAWGWRRACDRGDGRERRLPPRVRGRKSRMSLFPIYPTSQLFILVYHGN